MRVFVHKHKYSHEKRRKKIKELLKSGDAVCILENKDGRVYQLTKGVTL